MQRGRRQGVQVRAESYKCGKCGDLFNAKRIGKGLECPKCGQSDANKFAIAKECTTCEGEGKMFCNACGGVVSARVLLTVLLHQKYGVRMPLDWSCG